MKKRIFKYYIVLFICISFVTAFFTSSIAGKFYKGEVEKKLINIASSIKYHLIDVGKYQDIDYNSVSKNFSKYINEGDEETRLRVTFIDFKGNVLGDSEADFQSMENHIGRKEVDSSIKEGFGKDTRKSTTVNADLLYIAIAMDQPEVIIRVSLPLIEINEIYKLIWFYTILITLAAILLVVLISFKISKSLTKSLNELIFVSKEISKGKYNRRINIESKDELGQLSESFNEMAAKLEQTINDLKDKKMEIESIVDSMNAGIVAVDRNKKIILINRMAGDFLGVSLQKGVIGKNMLERIRNNQLNNIIKETFINNRPLESGYINMEDKILKLYTSPVKPRTEGEETVGVIVFIQDVTKIRKLEKIRTEFVSNVTHELKTPITSIRGFIETLKDGAINNKQVAMRFLDIIDIEAERLHVLIDDILLLSEIETKQTALRSENINIKSLGDEVISIVQSIADEKEVTLYNQVTKDIFIKGDKNRLKQLFLNLVDNAIKYNVKGGRVTIDAYKDEGKMVIKIKDTGIGIDYKHLPRLFERFYRVDKGRSRDLGGTGLGLSIVKHIVNLYNGNVKVNSKLGEGTEFIVQIPV
ncbi:two-component system histidine kinase PnpS [Acetivibrio saccincola]|jgi:two-component system phosphate regulon sensor histidine kinase PhoR|uniref:histidine kinase n=1 Tax=Acetivibrio saccincola TaxID=1677857 RepID=A0A2S8R6L0_9FIRM|nr:ATP-binding protein [Acetivibrio saccincola]NLI58789.1 cell wall metabolism sensor histidine kinase WalK [Clostridium sp.]PQQ65440.1 PAS domain-containing sensor histidine kinase [Acetivibrio saccincola]